MATEIDPAVELLSKRVMILADTDGGQPICTGVVERISASISNLIKPIWGEQPPPIPPSMTLPPRPVIGTLHAHVVFRLEGAQEVKMDGEDYFLIREEDVMGILPAPYEERLF